MCFFFAAAELRRGIVGVFFGCVVDCFLIMLLFVAVFVVFVFRVCLFIGFGLRRSFIRASSECRCWLFFCRGLLFFMAGLAFWAAC